MEENREKEEEMEEKESGGWRRRGRVEGGEGRGGGKEGIGMHAVLSAGSTVEL